MNGKPTNDDAGYKILILCVPCILIAAIWPLIYPLLDIVLAFISFGKAPGIFKAIENFGPLYGKFSKTAPGFFKGMAEGAQQMSGEDPYLASLPYLAKAYLLAYVTFPVYTAELFFFVLVVVISLLSRLLPWKLARNVIQRIAILLAMLPLVAISLVCIAFFLLAYFRSKGILDFIIMVLICPAVAMRVVSPNIGIFLLAWGLVPVGLVFAGRGSLARGVLFRFFRIFFGW